MDIEFGPLAAGLRGTKDVTTLPPLPLYAASLEAAALPLGSILRAPDDD